MSVGYNPASPGFDEARLSAYEALIVGNLSALNTALARDATTSSLGTITESMVTIGDPETVWNIATGPIRFRVVGGTPTGTPNMEAELAEVLNGNVGWEYRFHTTIRLYLHPDALANMNPESQATAREIALARIHDWFVLGVCNYWDPVGRTGGVIVNLGTNIMTDTETGTTDYLLETFVHETRKPTLQKGFGATQALRCLEFQLTGTLE